MTGSDGSRKGGRPVKVTGLRPGQWFGPWEVLRDGLRTGQTETFPYGHRAAEIRCKCKKVRIERESRLPGLARNGPECRHRTTGQPGSAPKAASAPRRTPREKTAAGLPAGWDAVRKQKPPPQPGSRRQHARPGRTTPVPASEITPGKQIGDWEITGTGLTTLGRQVVRIKCVTCGHLRTPLRGVVAGGRIRPCTHPGKKRRRPPSPGQVQVLAWIREHAPGRAVSAGEVAEATGLAKPAVTGYLRGLTAAGDLTHQLPGTWALTGVTVTGPAPDPGPDKIRAFLAAEGGGMFGEILAGTGLTHTAAVSHLGTLGRRGQITRLQDCGGWFYLLTGQEPGQRVDLDTADPILAAAC